MRPNQPRLCSVAAGVADDSWPNNGVTRARMSAKVMALHFMGGLISKRCKSCQTLYQSRMKCLCATALALLLAVNPVRAKDRHCMFRVHAEANRHDTAVFATAVPAKFSGKDIAIERSPRISEQDVTAFYPYSASDKTYGALIQLDEHGRFALDSLSIERRSGLLFVFINGRPITELEVDQRVSDGKIYIASGLTAADIALMKKDWRLIGQRKK
jgi:hypothetical protein